MSKTVEINQVIEAELLLALDKIAGRIGEHRDSADYYEKITKLAEDTVEELANIVLVES